MSPRRESEPLFDVEEVDDEVELPNQPLTAKQIEHEVAQLGSAVLHHSDTEVPVGFERVTQVASHAPQQRQGAEMGTHRIAARHQWFPSTIHDGHRSHIRHPVVDQDG